MTAGIVEDLNGVVVDRRNIDAFVYRVLSRDGELPFSQAMCFAEPLVLLLNDETSADLLGQAFGQRLSLLI